MHTFFQEFGFFFLWLFPLWGGISALILSKYSLRIFYAILLAVIGPPLLALLVAVIMLSTTNYRSGGYAAEQGMAALALGLFPTWAAMTIPAWLAYVWFANKYLRKIYKTIEQYKKPITVFIGVVIFIGAVTYGYSILPKKVYTDIELLREAVERSDHEEVSRIADRLAPVEDSHAFLFAIKKGDIKIIEILMQHGAFPVSRF